MPTAHHSKSKDVHKDGEGWLTKASSVRRRRMARPRKLRTMAESSWSKAPCKSPWPPSRADAAFASLRKNRAESGSHAPVASTTKGWKLIPLLWQTLAVFRCLCLTAAYAEAAARLERAASPSVSCREGAVTARSNAVGEPIL